MSTELYLSPISISLAFTLVLTVFAYPYMLLQTAASKSSKLRISKILNNMISFSVGIGLANWYLRMVPFSEMLVHRSSLGFTQPVAGSIIASGVLLAYVVTTASSLFNAELQRRSSDHTNTVERFVTGNKEYSYYVRALSSVTYTKIVLFSSIHFLIEGFSIGSANGMYSLALLHQLIITFVLGILALRTGCGAMKVTKIALLFVSALPLGIMGGLATGEENMHWISYVALGTVMCLVSGCYIHVMFDSVVVPELAMMDTCTTNLHLFLAGPVVFMACMYLPYNM
ncbi:unnamed protein product [Ixodes hexagonus]